MTVCFRLPPDRECPGKEVIQLYTSAVGTRSEQPLQELKGFNEEETPFWMELTPEEVREARHARRPSGNLADSPGI